MPDTEFPVEDFITERFLERKSGSSFTRVRLWSAVR
jgi:hypothetical protein